MLSRDLRHSITHSTHSSEENLGNKLINKFSSQMNAHDGTFLFFHDELWFLTWRRSGSDALLVFSRGRPLSATQTVEYIQQQVS